MDIPDGAIPVDQFRPAQQAVPQQHGIQLSGDIPAGAIPVDQFQSAEDVYGSIGQQALGAAEGFSQGLAGPIATAGEAGLSALGVPGLTPHEQKMRRSTNPVGSYGSEAAGFGLGALLGTGEAAALAKIGKAAETASGLSKLGEAASIGQKAASVGVRGAAEIAALEAGNEISKAINQDPGQTLGSAAINIGLAGVLGGAGGAILGSVSPMWRAFTNRAAEAEKVGHAALVEGEDDLARAILKPAEKESYLKGIQKQKPNADEILEAGKELGVPVSPGQTSASDFVQSLESAFIQTPAIPSIAARQKLDGAFEAVGKRLEPIFGADEGLSAFQRGQKIKDQVLNTVDNIYQPLKEKYAGRLQYAQTIQIPDSARLRQYDKLIELGQTIGEVGSKEGAEIANVAERMLAQNTAADLDKLISKLGTEQRMARISGNTELSHALGMASESIQDFQIKQIAKMGAELESQGAEHAKAIAADIVNEHKALKQQYASFKEILTDFLSDARLGKKGNTAGGIELTLENIPNEKLVEKLFDPKNSAGLERLKDKFPDVFKTVIDGKKADLISAAMKNGEFSHRTLLNSVEKLSPEIRNLMFNPQDLKTIKAAKTWIDALPKNVGPSGTPKGLAYFEAVKDLKGSLFANIKGYGIQELLKFSTPAEIESNKIAADYIEHAIKGERTLDRVTKSFFQTGQLLPTHLLPKESERKRLEASIDKMSDVNHAVSIGAGLAHHLPNHQAGITQMAAQAANYLNALKPNEAAATAFDKAPPIDKAAQAKYNRALDVANQPLLVLKHAKDGTLLPQDIQTLQAIYPSLHASMVHKISDQLADHKAKNKDVPYHQRQSLALLLGAPVDSTMMPQYMQAIIHSSAGQIPQQQGVQKTRPATQNALRQINKTNDMFQTTLERRSSGRH